MNIEEFKSQLRKIINNKNIQPFQGVSKESLTWFKRKVTELSKTSQVNKKFTLGKLYLFLYDPKTKDKLKYYDTFPLVIPLRITAQGFLGLNLHYLPPAFRANFLLKICDLAEEDRNNNLKSFNVTYDILKQSSKYKLFRPCLKQYLFSHVQSKIVSIKHEEWINVINLPFEMFKKETKETVWADSLKTANQRKKKTP